MPSEYPILNNRPIDQWKVTELKEELRRRKLTTRGLKEELVNRLNESICEERNALEQEELVNGRDSVPAHLDTQCVEHPNPSGSVQVEVNAALTLESKNINVESDSLIVDEDKSKITLDVNEEIKAGMEEFVTTSEPNISVSKNANPSVPMESTERVGHSSPHFESSEKNSIYDEKSDEKSENKIIDEDEEKEGEEIGKINRDTVPLDEDVNLNHPEPTNQVSEVKQDLGFPVNCESISTDTVSINEKNELKDNLNADNFHLELEVVKPEMEHQSSSDVAPIGGDVHPVEDIQETIENQGPEEMDDIANASYEDLGKKNDSVDGGYSEKLNLDRSSGEESMEEDVLESKQTESNHNSVVVEDKIDVEEIDVKEPSQFIEGSGGFSPPNKDVAEEGNTPFVPAMKRKLEVKESLGGIEPAKRLRRWNTETLKVPEQQFSSLTPGSTPKGLTHSTPKHSFMRSDSTVNEDAQKERIVPPSQKPPTNSLRIDRFLRPFTLKAVQELLAKTGTVCSFWMDNIKTHCYVMYSSEDEALETRNALYNLQWPPNGGRFLTAEFVDPQEVKMHAEAPPESSAPINPAPIAQTSVKQNQVLQHPSRQHGPRQQPSPPVTLPPPPPPPLSGPPQIKERLPPPPPSENPEPPILTLDDLFMKTKFSPRIYYLPLSGEQVAAKKEAQVKNSRN